MLDAFSYLLCSKLIGWSLLLDKQVNAQKEKIFRGSSKLPQAHKKCAMKMKVELGKNDARA